MCAKHAGNTGLVHKENCLDLINYSSSVSGISFNKMSAIFICKSLMMFGLYKLFL